MRARGQFARLRIAILGLFSLSGCLIAQNSVSADPLSFSAEDEALSRAMPLPTKVLAVLAQDPDIKDVPSSGGAFSDSWFLATELSLNETRERVVLVIGRGPLLGANVTTFWLFRPRDDRFEMILKVVAHTLRVRDTRTQNYLDIEIMSATARDVSMRVFKFDGERYRLASAWSEAIQ